MGNKTDKSSMPKRSKTTQEKPSNSLEEDEDFFVDIAPKKSIKKKNISPVTALEHNPLISEVKSDPFKDYTTIKELGSGSFATVYLVKHNISGNIRAMKAIQKITDDEDEDNELEIINEINILMKMDHPNIVKIFEFYNSSTHYYLITEYCAGGSLFDLIIKNGPFTEIQASYIMHQLFSVVNYCHKMKIIHRDLKPENILIHKNDNGFVKIKICDFGTSLTFNRGEIQEKIVGSIYYIAPEVLKKKYNSKCDLWSCGIIMYILLTGVPPFGGNDNQTIIKKILLSDYDKTRLNKKCKACIDLIDKLLERDVGKRIRAQDALNHKWFQIYKSYEIRVDIDDPKLIEFYLNNLKNYKKSSEIQEIALAYLVHNNPDLEEIDNAGKLFGIIDKKGKGKINKEELYNGLCELYKSDKLKEDVDKIFENLDVNNDLYLEFEEFVRAAIDKSIFFTESSLRMAYKYFDKDDKGEITVDDLCSIFSGEELSKHEMDKIRKMIKKISPDEKIKYEDFCKIMEAFILPKHPGNNEK
jgi:calcium-dependent protein kinase